MNTSINPLLHWRLAASLALACPIPLALAAPPTFEDSMAQRTLACTACHGQQGRAASDGYYPRIAGKPAGYLYNQLLHFRHGQRQYGLMTSLIDPLSKPYLREIAEHFAALDLPYPPPQPSTASPAVWQRGEQLALRGDATQRLPACMACHGARLTGVVPDVPGLLGLPRDYVNAQIGAWRTGQRKTRAPDCMHTIANRLSPDDVNAVASWLAAQPLPANTRPATAVPAPSADAMRCGSAPALPGPLAKGAP